MVFDAKFSGSAAVWGSQAESTITPYDDNSDWIYEKNLLFILEEVL